MSPDILHDNTVTDLVLSRFKSVKKQHSGKISKAKKLRAEKDGLSVVNIFKRRQLSEQIKLDIADFKEIAANIPHEDMPAVQEERADFRAAMKSLWAKIQSQYVYHSNYDLLKTTKDEIDMDLGEYRPHIRKSIRKNLERKRRQPAEPQRKRKKYVDLRW